MCPEGWITRQERCTSTGVTLGKTTECGAGGSFVVWRGGCLEPGAGDEPGVVGGGQDEAGS